MQKKPSHRNAFTLTELVVAATLMVSVMGIIAPLTVRCGQLWQDSRHQQIAMDELSNELERLISLGPDQRDQAITQLVPSDFLKTALPSSKITARTLRDEDGLRLELNLRWDRFGNPRSVTFVGWIDPVPIEDQAEANNLEAEAAR